MSDIGDSRVEDILEAGIEGESYEKRPQSRVEELLNEPIESGGGTVPIDPSESEIASYPDGKTWITDDGHGHYIYSIKINGKTFVISEIDSFAPYKLCFSSDGAFTLSVESPRWDGTIEYSIDNGKTWNTWDGSELSGTSSQHIYLRGTGNTAISKGEAWTFTGKYCIGNIETLLDYRTVANGQHPTMAASCYFDMFSGCTSLTIAPKLPATTLAASCYSYMFSGCTSLTIAPKLPATTLAASCYFNMFGGCTSLTIAPKLPATTLAASCYFNMFGGCTSLAAIPKLPATILAASCYSYMFDGCTSLKLSDAQIEEYQYAYRIPTLGIGATANRALNGMFTDTGGTFTGTPTIDITYYTDHEPVG